VILFGIGLLGEYIGRMYQQVRGRPRYVVQTILEQADARSTQHARAAIES
ncbi:MAG TPA: glycosyltransferase, partial [Oxalobacteraceae bacterium]|nr:glycosyltransferase [Oxalobacteraceae bacterium]